MQLITCHNSTQLETMKTWHAILHVDHTWYYVADLYTITWTLRYHSSYHTSAVIVCLWHLNKSQFGSQFYILHDMVHWYLHVWYTYVYVLIIKLISASIMYTYKCQDSYFSCESSTNCHTTSILVLFVGVNCCSHISHYWVIYSYVCTRV